MHLGLPEPGPHPLSLRTAGEGRGQCSQAYWGRLPGLAGAPPTVPQQRRFDPIDGSPPGSAVPGIL